MIKIKINDKVYGFEKEELETELIGAGVEKLQEAMANMGGMAGVIKSSLGSLMPMLGIQKPKELKEMDNLEYIIRMTIETSLTALENKVIEIEAKEITEEV